MIDKDKIPMLKQDKFKVLFIDGESLFNFVYNAFIQVKWDSEKGFNSLNPLFNYIFKIIYRTPDLDNYTYSYDNFFEDTRGFVIDNVVKQANVENYEKFLKNISKDTEKHNYFKDIDLKLDKYKQKLIEQVGSEDFDWKSLSLSIINYLSLFVNNIYATYSKVFIAFDWVNAKEEQGFYDPNIPFNETFRNIVLNRIYKNTEFLYLKNLKEKFSPYKDNESTKNLYLYNDLISHLRIENNEKEHKNWSYESIRKNFIDCLMEMNFNIITIPLLESYDTIYTYLNILKYENDWERRLSFLGQDNFNHQGSFFYLNSSTKVPIEYFIFSQNDIFRSMLANDVTRIKIRKKTNTNVEYFEFETLHWFLEKYKFFPSSYNDYSFLTFKPFLNNNSGQKIVGGFLDKEAKKFLNKFQSIEKFEKFAYEFWENHEIIDYDDNTKLCYKKFGNGYYIRCLNNEKANFDEHKEKFNLTRTDIEYFIKVYKLIYGIENNEELKELLSYDKKEIEAMEWKNDYYKKIYNRSKHTNKFKYNTCELIWTLNRFNSDFNLFNKPWFNFAKNNNIYNYARQYMKNKSLYRKPIEKTSSYYPAYAPIATLKSLFSPLNINSSLFNTFFYEINEYNPEISNKITELISWYAFKNKYLNILINNLDFVGKELSDLEEEKVNKNIILVDNHFITGFDLNLLNVNIIGHFSKDKEESELINKIKLDAKNSKEMLINTLLNEKLSDENNRWLALGNPNWLEQYIFFDFLFSDEEFLKQVFKQRNFYNSKFNFLNLSTRKEFNQQKIISFSTKLKNKFIEYKYKKNSSD